MLRATYGRADMWAGRYEVAAERMWDIHKGTTVLRFYAGPHDRWELDRGARQSVYLSIPIF